MNDSGDLRRIDALIAEHVYGKSAVYSDYVKDWAEGEPVIEETAAGTFYSCRLRNSLQRYSTDIALAMEVLAKIEAERKTDWKIWRSPGSHTLVEIGGNSNCWGPAMPLSEAICRHVLHVLGVEA